MGGSRERSQTLKSWACRRGRGAETGQICGQCWGRCGERRGSEGPGDGSSNFLCLSVFICKVGIGETFPEWETLESGRAPSKDHGDVCRDDGGEDDIKTLEIFSRISITLGWTQQTSLLGQLPSGITHTHSRGS